MTVKKTVFILLRSGTAKGHTLLSRPPQMTKYTWKDLH